MALVLPVPAPASTQTGPRVARATSCCWGSRAESTASGPWPVPDTAVTATAPPVMATRALGAAPLPRPSFKPRPSLLRAPSCRMATTLAPLREFAQADARTGLLVRHCDGRPEKSAHLRPARRKHLA